MSTLHDPPPALPASPLRLDTTDIAVCNTVRERWLRRLLICAGLLSSARSIAKWDEGGTMIAIEVGLGVLLAVAMMAYLAASELGGRIVGVRVPGRPGTVVLDAGLEIAIEGRSQRFARDEIASGWTESFAAGGDDVVLRMRDGALVRWRARDEGEARAALRAAGVAPEHRAVTLPLGLDNRAWRIFCSFLVAPVGLAACAGGVVAARAHWAPGAVTVGVAVMAAVLVARLFKPFVTSALRIGTDGIVIRRPFRRRFVPRASFRGVTVQVNEIAISVAHETPTTLRVSSADEAVIVARRIEDAMAERDGAGPAAQAQLDRGARPIGVWLRDVRAGGRGASGYREAQLDREALYAVVSDGAASAERRIAAAAVLGCDEEGKARARIAAQACVNNRLRVAIEEATKDDVEEARIEEALRATEGQRHG